MNPTFLDHQHYYLVGIKGVAMTGLAQILLDAGKSVRGSDTGETFVTTQLLKSMQLNIDTSFDTELPEETECVVFTGAHQGSLNAQVQAAKARGLAIFSHAQALGELSQLKSTIAVCGVGGKSTIAAMMAWIFEQSGKSPSYAVGVGEIQGLRRNAAWNTDSDIFIVEADEYSEDPSNPDSANTPRFRHLQPDLIICTNISFDHPDVYRSAEDTQTTFESFFRQLKPGGVLITHETVRAAIPESVTHLTYGKQGTLRYEPQPYRIQGISTATLHTEADSAELTMHLPGEHNLENATGAILGCMQLGLTLQEAATGLATFTTTSRRFEYKGSFNQALLYDDYAHHPREIVAALQTLTEYFPDRTPIVAFQPHTYSRTTALFDDFVAALGHAQHIVILDIFASARETARDGQKTSGDLARAVSELHPSAIVAHVPGVDELAAYCRNTLDSSAILLTLGAGDIYHVHTKLTQDSTRNEQL